MNIISWRRWYFLLLFIMAAAMVPACKKDNGGVPSITGVRNYVPSPGDTLLGGLVPNGQWVVIAGQHLQNPVEIAFDGVPASFNSALFSPGSAVVQLPAIVFSTIDTSELYTIRYVTRSGSTTFSFKLGPAAPVITAISNVFANPGDSCFIYGTDLVLVQHFSYGGSDIASFRISTDGTSLGFVMPSQTSTDQVVVKTRSGTVNFKIAATPTITGVSNENANPGDSVYIYGTYLKNIELLSFAGTGITSFVSADDGDSVGFVLPALTGSGPVSVTTKFGSAVTVYNVNDIATGALSNWEWGGVFNWKYWGGASLYSGNSGSGWPPYTPDFPGNPSQFMVLKTGVLVSGEGNTYSSYAILLDSTKWVAPGDLGAPPADWAFKFEASIPGGWNGGSIDIQSSSGLYVARWEPWQTTATSTSPFSTRGWVTVTIPLTSFRAKDATLGEGKGASIGSVKDLTGASGGSSCTMYIHNYSTSSTPTGFYGAFDNLRVVKIK